MGNELVTPKVHLLTRLTELDDSIDVMTVDARGQKFKTSLADIKQWVLKEVLEQLEKKEEVKVTKATIIKELAKGKSVSFGKPINIKSSTGVEKGGRSGDIYSTDTQVRANIGGTWFTIFKK